MNRYITHRRVDSIDPSGKCDMCGTRWTIYRWCLLYEVDYIIEWKHCLTGKKKERRLSCYICETCAGQGLRMYGMITTYQDLYQNHLSFLEYIKMLRQPQETSKQ